MYFFNVNNINRIILSVEFVQEYSLIEFMLYSFFLTKYVVKTFFQTAT